MTTKPKRFELWDVDSWMLIDRNVDLPAFFKLNAITPKEAAAIDALTVGASFHLGGGAAPLCALRRAE